MQCPYGAITLEVDGKAMVETEDLDHVTTPAEIGTKHMEVKKQGVLSTSGAYFLKIFQKLSPFKTTLEQVCLLGTFGYLAGWLQT